MKYKDKHLSVEADAIPLLDTDRPTQALIDLFNPDNNPLLAQSRGILARINAISHEFDEPFSLGINDKALHCIMPIIIYGRKSGYKDEFYSVSNNLLIRNSKLAHDLLVSVSPKFYEDSVALLDDIFKSDKFVFLIFNISDEKAIHTAIEKLSKKRGLIMIHNPKYRNTTSLMKFCLDKNIHLIENIDGSAELLRF